jgi:hypothetical protein
MKTYLNKGGSHTCRDGTVVPRGATVTTDEDLIAKFGKKFELVQPAPVVAKSPVQQAAEKGAEDGDEGNDDGDSGADDGMADVTEDFPAATEADLTVKKDKRGWWVFDGDEDPANEKPLRKKGVDAFLEEYLAE